MSRRRFVLIRELAARLGISTDAVRYYEREGLLDGRHVTRRPNRYRDYGEAAVQRLRLLAQARRAGMSIAEVKVLATAFDDGSLTIELQLQLLGDKLADLDRRARELKTTRAGIAAKIAELESRLPEGHRSRQNAS